MTVAERLNELARIQRPFSHPFRIIEGDAYLIDDTFAFGIGNFFYGRQVLFVADAQLQIIREHAKKDGESHGRGIKKLAPRFTPNNGGVYLGDKYKFSFGGYQDWFQLRSANPIKFEPLPKDIDLRELVSQRTPFTNT